MNNQVNEVLEKIREVCDLKRLEFGCEIKRGDIWDMVTSSDPKGVWTVDEGYWLKNEITEIIGLTVQLNHLLLAFIKKHGCIEIDTQMDNTLMMSEMGTSEYVKYDLTKSVEDNLRSNPELTLFIYNLICV